MGSKVSGLVERLSKPDAIRYQVLTYLFVARFHNPIRLSYDKYAATAGSVARKQRPCLETHKIKSALPDDEINNATSEFDNTTTIRRAREHTASASTNYENYSWDWRGFPELWRPLARYDLTSNCWMIYASVRTLLLGQFGNLIDSLSSWLLGIPGHCLLMGRIAVPFAISQLFSLVLASYHLVWRSVQKLARHNRLLSVIVFLLASERDLEHFYALLRAEEEFRAQPLPEDLPSLLALADSQEYHNAQYVTARGLRQGLGNFNRKPAAEELPNCLRFVGQAGYLFRQVMCYKVESFIGPKRVYFKLRPNRTREARRKLSRRLAAVTLIALTGFALEFLFFFNLIMLSVLSDYRYALIYPGCYPLLDERLARGELTLWPLSITIKNHHLISYAFDTLENAILWADSGLALTLVPSFAYLVNYDLLVYWSQLNRRLESVLARSINEHSSASRHGERLRFQRTAPSYIHTGSSLAQGDFTSAQSAPSLLPMFNRSQHLLKKTSNASTCRLSRRTNVTVSKVQSILGLERDIQELQSEVYDFFHQVEYADMFVGDVLTMFIFIWLIACAFIAYNLVLKEVSSKIVIFVLFLGFSILTMTSYHMFQLRRCCSKTYRTLCSLMAHDRTRKKRHFMALLDFYLNRDSTTYHLCRSHAYKPTTFVTIIGWTFSSFFIVYSLLIVRKRDMNTTKYSSGTD